jgi:hypothetical protein
MKHPSLQAIRSATKIIQIEHNSSDTPVDVQTTIHSCEGPLLQLGAFGFQQELLLYMMGGNLAVCVAYVANICIDDCVS